MKQLVQFGRLWLVAYGRRWWYIHGRLLTRVEEGLRAMLPHPRRHPTGIATIPARLLRAPMGHPVNPVNPV